MRGLLALLLTVLLAGCGFDSPQKAQYEAEYSHRQDIRAKNVYRFQTTPVKTSGKKYWGAGDLAQLFYVQDDKASVLELSFSYPAKSLKVTSLDRENNVLREKTYLLLDESAAAPANPDTGYVYLTKDGQLMKKVRSCKPDMSVGCQWWNHRLFITRGADLAVQYESGGAGLAFLVIPTYGSNEYLEIFPQTAGS